MTNEIIIRRGLDLFNLMTLDTEAVWTVLDDHQRHEMDTKLQQYDALAAAGSHTEDLEEMLQHVLTITSGVVQFVDATPELKTLLFPAGVPDATNPPTLGIRQEDLGDTENERRSRLQRFIEQLANNLVVLRKEAPSQPTPTERQQS